MKNSLHYIYILIMAITTGSCSGYTIINKPVNDLYKIRFKTIESADKQDTLIILHEGCSGCIDGIEDNIFIIKNPSSETTVKRYSNFQEYKLKKIKPFFPWYYIFKNFTELKNEKILTKTTEKTPDGSLYISNLDASHGRYTELTIKIGNQNHYVYMSHWMEQYYDNSLNLIVIDRIKASMYKTVWKPLTRNRIGIRKK